MNKFGAIRDTRAGRSFASKGEAQLYDYLIVKQRAKEISDLKCQVSVYLTNARILYIPDFSYLEYGEKVWAEFKGFETAIWRIKRRLWKHYGPGRLEVYTKGRIGIMFKEVLNGPASIYR